MRSPSGYWQGQFLRNWWSRTSSGNEQGLLLYPERTDYAISAERKNRLMASRVLPISETIDSIVGDTEVIFAKPAAYAKKGKKKMTIRDLEAKGG